MKVGVISILVQCCALASCIAALNQDQCLKDLRSGHLRSLTSDNRSLGLDNSGHTVPDANATAISYFDCVDFCPDGQGQEPFSWSMFTQQFAAWMLPWIALLSQLPFGAESKLDDFMSVVLTLGSPVLAGYSIVLTALNDSYVTSRLSDISYPNIAHAISVLSGLQQAPLQVADMEGLLASLPNNNEWWEIAHSLTGHEHTWSITAFSGIAWVIVAYALTIVDAFADISPSRTFISADGPQVSSLWVWLLPVVVGWLIISPNCEASKLQNAIREAKKSLYTSQEDTSDNSFSSSNSDVRNGPLLFKQPGTTLLYDEACSPPVFNYARLFYWTSCVEQVVEVFRAASEEAESVKSIEDQPQRTRLEIESPGPAHLNAQLAMREEVIERCQYSVREGVWGRGIFLRMAVASFMGLMLQWLTAGAAVVIAIYRDKIYYSIPRIGCRSGSYLLYALASSLSWFLLALSSVLAYYCDSTPPRKERRLDSPDYPPHPFLRELAIALNMLGKLLCTLNALWIVCACMLHFSNTFNRCLCNSGIFGGRSAKDGFVVMISSERTQYIWIYGTAMTLVSATVFVGFVWMKQRRPR